MNILRLNLSLALLTLSGCGLVYTNVRVPRSYRSATPMDVKSKDTDTEVSGEACTHSLLFLVAWGNGGYAEASKQALKNAEKNAILYDVKSDMRVKSYLVGLYSSACTIVTGKASQP